RVGDDGPPQPQRRYAVERISRAFHRPAPQPGPPLADKEPLVGGLPRRRTDPRLLEHADEILANVAARAERRIARPRRPVAGVEAAAPRDLRAPQPLLVRRAIELCEHVRHPLEVEADQRAACIEHHSFDGRTLTPARSPRYRIRSAGLRAARAARGNAAR